MSSFGLIGLIFISLGIVLLVTSNAIIECQKAYGDPDCDADSSTPCTVAETLVISAEDCTRIPEYIDPPVFVYYQLNNFFQNHRRYVKSRDDGQLNGKVYTEASQIQACDPIITNNQSKVLSPCGLVAWSVFNDTYSLLNQAGNPITVDDSADTIAWSSDVENRFKNPPIDDPGLAEVDQWLNETIFPGKVENGHFIVWMRNAALPDFRKLYGRINTRVELPLRVDIQNRYPVAVFGGKKSFVVTTTSWIGGKNAFLGISFIVTGTTCIVMGLFCFIRHWKKPRQLGDVRYLGWTSNKK